MGMFKDMKKMKQQGKEMKKQSGQRGGIGGMKDMISQSSDLMDGALEMQASIQVLQTGAPATAVLKATRETGEVVNMQPAVEFDLEVSQGGGAPYPVTHKETLPPTMAAFAQPGTTLQVKVDPADPSKLAIDWTATQTAASQQG